MQALRATISEDITVTKTVLLSVPDDATDDYIEEQIREYAYARTIYDADHGWTGTDVSDVRVEWEAASER